MMQTVATITLPFPSPSQNELDRWHWSRRSRLRDECRLLIRAQMRIQGLSPDAPPLQRRRVEVLRVGARLLDFGNLVGGCKPIIDALRLERLLFDDSPKWVIESYRQATAKKDHSTRIDVLEVT